MIGERFESSGRWNWSFIQLCKAGPSLKQNECVVSLRIPQRGPGGGDRGQHRYRRTAGVSLRPLWSPDRDYSEERESVTAGGFILVLLSLSFLGRYFPFWVTERVLRPIPATYGWRQGVSRQWFDILTYTVLYIDILQLYFYAVFYRSSHASCIVYGL